MFSQVFWTFVTALALFAALFLSAYAFPPAKAGKETDDEEEEGGDDDDGEEEEGGDDDLDMDMGGEGEGGEGGGDDDGELFDLEDMVGDSGAAATGSPGGLGGGGGTDTAGGTAGASTMDPAEEDRLKSEICAVMNEGGMHCDPNEPLASFLKHILTAMKTGTMMREKMKQEAGGGMNDPNGQQQQGGNGQPPTEEERPYMMSAETKALLATDPKTITDPEKRQLLIIAQQNHKAAESHRQLLLSTQFEQEKTAATNLIATIDRMVKRGLQPYVANKLKAKIGEPGGFQMSTSLGSAKKGKLAGMRRITNLLKLVDIHLPGVKEKLLSAIVTEQKRPTELTRVEREDGMKRATAEMIEIAKLEVPEHLKQYASKK